MREGHTVYLSAEADDAEVYYTTDGTNPVLGDVNTKVIIFESSNVLIMYYIWVSQSYYIY